MTPADSISRYRLRTLPLAREIGNVRAAIVEESEKSRSNVR